MSSNTVVVRGLPDQKSGLEEADLGDLKGAELFRLAAKVPTTPRKPLHTFESSDSASFFGRTSLAEEAAVSRHKYVHLARALQQRAEATRDPTARARVVPTGRAV